MISSGRSTGADPFRAAAAIRQTSSRSDRSVPCHSVSERPIGEPARLHRSRRMDFHFAMTRTRLNPAQTCHYLRPRPLEILQKIASSPDKKSAHRVGLVAALRRGNDCGFSFGSHAAGGPADIGGPISSPRARNSVGSRGSVSFDSR